MEITSACRLYLVTPSQFDPEPFAKSLEEALDAGNVACVQLRMKDADDDAVRKAAEILIPVCRSRDIAFLINDRPDLAVETDADGVHVGQQDEDARRARQVVGEDRTVGVTCHDSRHLAMVAAEQGADYVAFGAAFPTQTKDTLFRAEPELFQWWSDLIELPCVAIGGLTAANCAPIVKAGADFLAVCSAVWEHPEGPRAAVLELNTAIQDALNEG